MQRINITTMIDGEQRVAGWFDLAAAEEFRERREAFDGANLAGVHLRDQNRGQVLYRTAGGRFVLHQWSRWQGEYDSYEYIGADRAREWLMLNGDDDVIERLFGEPVQPESPSPRYIGEPILIRMPEEMIAALDARAQRDGLSRAEVVRTIIAAAL